MFGDPAANAPVWQKGAVLLGSLTATTPTGNAAFQINNGTTITTEWDPVGALDDSSPFDDGEESIEVTSHSAFGFGTYAKTYKNQEERVTFTALETTLVTLGILYDAAGVTDTGGNLSGVLKQRDPSEKFMIAFHRENGTDIERKISRSYCYIDNISRAFGDGKATRTVTVFVVPEADGGLYDYYLGAKA